MLDKAKILIIDDEKAARYGMRKALEHQGYEIAEAEDGESGLRQMEQLIPDLVICDISMPVMDGMTFLRKVIDGDYTSPVVMITAYGSERVAVEAMKAGAYDYICKPYEVDELRLIVRNALEKVQLERENRALKSEVERRGGFGEIIIAEGVESDIDGATWAFLWPNEWPGNWTNKKRLLVQFAFSI